MNDPNAFEDDDLVPGGSAQLSGGADVLAAILRGPGGGAGLLPPDSRYSDVGTAIYEMAAPDTTSGVRRVVYFRRRFLPEPSTFATLREHIVTDGERLDLIAARELGDPLAFWKLCDANRLARPLAFNGPPGSRLVVPLPAGVPGAMGGM